MTTEIQITIPNYYSENLLSSASNYHHSKDERFFNLQNRVIVTAELNVSHDTSRVTSNKIITTYQLTSEEPMKPTKPN